MTGSQSRVCLLHLANQLLHSDGWLPSCAPVKRVARSVGVERDGLGGRLQAQWRRLEAHGFGGGGVAVGPVLVNELPSGGG